MNVEGAKDGDSLKLNGILEDLFAVLINSRKMGIKAVGTLELTVEELAELVDKYFDSMTLKEVAENARQQMIQNQRSNDGAEERYLPH